MVKPACAVVHLGDDALGVLSDLWAGGAQEQGL